MTTNSRTELARRTAVRDAARLSDQDLHGMLEVLDGWSNENDALAKTFRFTDYAGTIGFVNALAWVAQRMDHHPDLEVGYNRCRVLWTTHDAHGITMNDCIAAARTDELMA